MGCAFNINGKLELVTISEISVADSVFLVMAFYFKMNQGLV